MKKMTFRLIAVLSIILAFLAISTSGLAQAPQKISYQAAIRDASGQLIVSQPVGVQISILQGSDAGLVVYSETHSATTTPNGIISIEIGGGTLVSGNFNTIDWKSGLYFMKTETDPTGGSTYTITGTTGLISIPYAFWSASAGNSFTSHDYNDLTNKPVTDGSETKINGGTFVDVTGSGTNASPYIISSNPVMGGFSHYLGEYYNGGIIFYLYKRYDGTEHALIVSLTESETSLALQNPSAPTGATSTWNGADNSSKYTNSPAVTYATGLGYGWYLPAIDELNLLWQNRYHVNKGLAAVGGTLLSDAWHWSSTEFAAITNRGWQLSFITSETRNLQAKADFEKVRAIRGLITTPTQLTTTAATDITNASALSGGNILSDEGSPISARGICWSTSPNPTTSDSKTLNGTGFGAYASTITGLTNNTTYYVRAYATNGAGTAYGDEKSFTTASTAPVVTTTAVSSLTMVSASGGGNVTDERGEAVTERGVCWSTSANPTIANSKTSDGTGGGVFTSSITGLTAGTTYYVRAFATNSVGTSYGNEISFTSLNIPSVTTFSYTLLTLGRVSTGGNVGADGGAAVTARGLCWSTSANPTISDSKTTNGAGLGTFSTTVTGLTLGTKYYLRAYATNSQGTGYGVERVFFALTEGDTYLGGKVARVYVSGDAGYVAGQLHGLIAASADQSTSSVWSDVMSTLIGPTAQSLTNGLTNSNAIVAQFGHNASAAKICLDFVDGAYSDWYLPAYYEMEWVYQSSALIGGFTTSSYYWSSTENDNSTAYRLRFSDADWNPGSKGGTANRVRAVRKF